VVFRLYDLLRLTDASAASSAASAAFDRLTVCHTEKLHEKVRGRCAMQGIISMRLPHKGFCRTYNTSPLIAAVSVRACQTTHGYS
jgi:hypothetical protein